ncbi:MAG: hypothetical protein A2X36_07130 [Elusimicrobia bacterium GWA2_69_24]|nr:MAG: hypothetical protein A2X36_07130 [Elusimicrobia bacterium GWA2_69_24]HBL15205.1 hypothetical protein [Elusimicrobiota bacterium]
MRLAVLFLTLAFLHRPAEARTANAPQPGAYAGYNLIVLSLGNVGTGHMSLFGYARKTTPRLDRWGADALVFDNAFSPASWTLPVAASWLTGLYPFSHRILNRVSENLLPPGIRTLPELLRSRGYRTAAFTGGLDYYRDFSTMRGFSETDSNPNFTGFGTTLAQAQAWLARRPRGPFMLFVHGYDAHCPFTPPPDLLGTFSDPKRTGITVDSSRCVRGAWRPEKGDFQANYTMLWSTAPVARVPEPVHLTQADIDFLGELYDEEVLSVDAQLGSFLASLDRKLREKTIVVVFSEHGEMFAKHGRFGRAGATRGTLYDDVIHVPLAIRVPGLKGRRIPALVELTDLAPTLASWLGVAIPYAPQGKDLSPLLRGAGRIHDHIFAGLPFLWPRNPERPESVNDSVRNREWKLIREIRWSTSRWRRWLGRPPKTTLELYRIAADPEERRNVAPENPEVVEGLLRELDAWRTACGRFLPRAPGTRPVPAQLLEDAKNHGYWP